MPTIYTGGRVFTADLASPWAEALVTDGELIVAVGSLAECSLVAGDDCERVDVTGCDIAGVGGVLGWLVNTAASALVGLLAGFLFVAVVARVKGARGGDSHGAPAAAAAH